MTSAGAADNGVLPSFGSCYVCAIAVGCLMRRRIIALLPVCNQHEHTKVSAEQMVASVCQVAKLHVCRLLTPAQDASRFASVSHSQGHIPDVSTPSTVCTRKATLAQCVCSKTTSNTPVCPTTTTQRPGLPAEAPHTIPACTQHTQPAAGGCSLGLALGAVAQVLCTALDVVSSITAGEHRRAEGAAAVDAAQVSS